MSDSTHDEETINANERGRGLSLRVVLGDHVVSHDLPERGEVVLGRAREADIFVDDPSVSRLHAKIRIDGPVLSLEDLGSANGTRLSGRPLEAQRLTAVAVGDAIELGDVLVVVQRGRATRTITRPTKGASFARSPAMKPIEQLVDKIAPGTISVLLVGETGVGKEVIAEEIRRRSRRAKEPYVRLNCAAFAENLLESEWFGHERGAFTGALQAKPGLLETANGGTVLLDEVGELSPNLQAKLLRVLEERSVMRVGGLRARVIDVRFIAATNRDLSADVAAGRFRQDLFFRLNGVSIHIPPLRDRREEIAALATELIADACASGERARPPVLSSEALAWLEAYSWPGNVRELRNTMDRAVLLSSSDTISPAELPVALKPRAIVERSPGSEKGSLREAVADVEKQRVLAALAESHGNQKRAAELLGISRGTLLARLDAFGIPRPRKI